MAEAPKPAEAAAPTTLTQRLSGASTSGHKRSNTLLLAKVATLFTDRQLYGQAIGCFYLVFAELEAALQQAMAKDARVGALKDAMQPLWRVPAYEADLEFYLGKGFEQRIPRSAAIQAYINRIHELAASDPLLLLAHAFTQHTAGLSGGRMLKKLCVRYMRLPEDQGTAIFSYEGGVELKEGFKRRLDGVGATLSEEEVQALLAEHVAAFDLNIGIMRAFRVPLHKAAAAPFRVIPVSTWFFVALILAMTGAIVYTASQLHRP